MKRHLKIALALLFGLSALNAYGAGDAQLGKAKAVYCATCHGEDGKRELPLITGGSSRLAGMEPAKFISGMKAYREGRRFHPMMQFFVMPISEKDMEDMAAWYASLGPNLYQRLGGREAINAVVKDLLANGLADARLNPRLSKLNAAKCEAMLTDQLCEATGGPCKYTGRDMKTAHAGKNVTEVEWQAFAENLVKTFDRFNVPARERGELLSLIVPMKGDIVGR